MWYADGGGLTAERRAAREGIRLEAGQRFARGGRTSDIARDLRVSECSVEQWRRNWCEGGMAGLRSKGPAKLPKLSDERCQLLDRGGVAAAARHGWSWQSPARRALERDEHAVELWKKDVWPQVEAPRRRSGLSSSSRTRPGSR
ncbi:winged helix-turn-helix domain-containing protein [Streptomyces sp. NBC_01007]|nr:winged helix-turn-helix domain-containing protein [Streptomyces sp. NBC_01007]